MWSESITFPTPHVGHSRHGLFFTRLIVNPMLNLLKRTMIYPEFEPGTFGLATTTFKSSRFRSWRAYYKIGEFILLLRISTPSIILIYWTSTEINSNWLYWWYRPTQTTQSIISYKPSLRVERLQSVIRMTVYW
jgi:hypothetical protein